MHMAHTVVCLLVLCMLDVFMQKSPFGLAPFVTDHVLYTICRYFFFYISNVPSLVRKEVHRVGWLQFNSNLLCNHYNVNEITVISEQS